MVRLISFGIVRKKKYGFGRILVKCGKMHMCTGSIGVAIGKSGKGRENKSMDYLPYVILRGIIQPSEWF